MSVAIAKVVGSICLYGSQECGAGYLAAIGPLKDGQLYGTGDPVLGRSMTQAVWIATHHFSEAGIYRGIVKVYASGGKLVADYDLATIKYFGELKWEPAPVYTIAMEDILAAAEQPI
jgi:hypothetical protein